MQPLSFPNFEITSFSDQSMPVPGGYLLTGSSISLEFDREPKLYYRHGWQSWSLTTWQDPIFQFPSIKPAILHPLQTDPVYAKHPVPNGSWLGATEFEDGNVLLLGALDLDAHVALHAQQSRGELSQLHGWYEAGSGEWFVGYGEEIALFAQYAELLGKRLGTASGNPAPRVWCSWYSLYSAIDEGLLERIFDGLGDLPFDVLQVDDGWEVGIGDWSPNDKFPSGMEALATKIRATGRTPGLWLAPLLAVPSSSLFRQHPGWLLRDTEGRLASAGHLWGEQLYALDTSHPAALDWLAALMKQVRNWGFDYLKLDFLYAGALPGKRYADMPREVAYRQGLRVLREAIGTDAYFLTCGAPMIPSLGLCDAIRVGPDVAGRWERYRDAKLLCNPTTPGTKNAIRTSVNRLWLNSLVATDPDVAYFRSQHNTLTCEQKRMLQDLALICNFKASSDIPQWLSANELEELRTFLGSTPDIKRTSRYTFMINNRAVDFSSAIPLPDPPNGLEALGSAVLGWAGNQGWAMKLLDWLGKRTMQKTINGL